MYTTRGIEVIATVTELRSKTSELIGQSKALQTGILIQKNNEPEAVLIGYERYFELVVCEQVRRAEGVARAALAGSARRRLVAPRSPALWPSSVCPRSMRPTSSA